MGKKIKITEKQIAELEILASRGITHQQMADYLGISRVTFYERLKEHPNISNSIKKGKSKGIAKIANVVFNKAEKGNLTAAIFYLKCRGGWNDHHDDENSERPEENDEYTNKTDKELKDELEAVILRQREREARENSKRDTSKGEVLAPSTGTAE